VSHPIPLCPTRWLMAFMGAFWAIRCEMCPCHSAWKLTGGSPDLRTMDLYALPNEHGHGDAVLHRDHQAVGLVGIADGRALSGISGARLLMEASEGVDSPVTSGNMS
jgi:hypothetical protein